MHSRLSDLRTSIGFEFLVPRERSTGVFPGKEGLRVGKTDTTVRFRGSPFSFQKDGGRHPTPRSTRGQASTRTP